jgi:hypothetical protein
MASQQPRRRRLEDEEWDIFCLNPANSRRKAVASLAPEIEYLARESAPRELDSPRPG